MLYYVKLKTFSIDLKTKPKKKKKEMVGLTCGRSYGTVTLCLFVLGSSKYWASWLPSILIKWLRFSDAELKTDGGCGGEQRNNFHLCLKKNWKQNFSFKMMRLTILALVMWAPFHYLGYVLRLFVDRGCPQNGSRRRIRRENDANRTSFCHLAEQLVQQWRVLEKK